mgnify:FL=1
MKSMIVSRDSGIRTLMAGEEAYWDKEGVYHYHDPNEPPEIEFGCTNEHTFFVKNIKKCGCRIILLDDD